MEHRPFDRLDADIASVGPLTARKDRLRRWAEVLEREPDARLKTLEELEFSPRSERPAMRAPNSPFSVAYADPVLRAAGLTGDTLGDALGFFQISEGEAHRVVCSCLNGRSMLARTAALKVRALASRQREKVTAAVLGVGVALPVLISFFS